MMLRTRFLLLISTLAACTPDTKSSQASAPAVIMASPPPTAIKLVVTPTPQTTITPSIAPLTLQPKQIKKIAKVHSTPRSTSAPVVDHDYQQALFLLQKGRITDANVLLYSQLRSTPDHVPARKLLATILIDNGKNNEAEALLQEGQQLIPASSDIAMTLARIQINRGALNKAEETLWKTAPHAKNNAPYLAFMASLQQQNGHHEQADQLLGDALKISPGQGTWLLAQALSRKALHNKTGARDSFLAAHTSGQLSPEQDKIAKQNLLHLSQ